MRVYRLDGVEVQTTHGSTLESVLKQIKTLDKPYLTSMDLQGDPMRVSGALRALVRRGALARSPGILSVRGNERFYLYYGLQSQRVQDQILEDYLEANSPDPRITEIVRRVKYGSEVLSNYDVRGEFGQIDLIQLQNYVRNGLLGERYVKRHGNTYIDATFWFPAGMTPGYLHVSGQVFDRDVHEHGFVRVLDDLGLGDGASSGFFQFPDECVGIIPGVLHERRVSVLVGAQVPDPIAVKPVPHVAQAGERAPQCGDDRPVLVDDLSGVRDLGAGSLGVGLDLCLEAIVSRGCLCEGLVLLLPNRGFPGLLFGVHGGRSCAGEGLLQGAGHGKGSGHRCLGTLLLLVDQGIDFCSPSRIVVFQGPLDVDGPDFIAGAHMGSAIMG